MILNGQPAEIGCSKAGELSLSCRGSYGEDGSAKLLSVSFPSISARVEDILKKYGVFEVVTFFCEDSPLFQVTFSSEHSLKQFVQSKGRMEKELAGLFSKMLQPPQLAGSPANPIPAQVNSKLFLMTPDWLGNECGSQEVTSDNFSECIFVWRDSKVFEFGDVLNQQKYLNSSRIRSSKGTSTSNLTQSHDKGTNTSYLRQLLNIGTSTSNLVYSKVAVTSTSDLRQSENQFTSTSDLRLSHDKSTSTSDPRLSHDKRTSTSDLKQSQDKSTSISNLRLSLDDSTSTSDLRQSQDKGTNTIGLTQSQDKSTSTSDLTAVQSSSEPSTEADSSTDVKGLQQENGA